MRCTVTLLLSSGIAKFSARLWNSQKDNVGGTMTGFFLLLLLYFPSLAYCTMSDEGLLVTIKKCFSRYKSLGSLAHGGCPDLASMQKKGHSTPADPSSSSAAFCFWQLLSQANLSRCLHSHRKVVINILLNADTGNNHHFPLWLLAMVKFWKYPAIFKSNFYLVSFI